MKTVEKEGFIVIGLPIKVSLKDPEYQKKIMDSWKDFMKRAYEIKNRTGPEFYGICDVNEGIEGDECSFQNVASVAVSSEESVPEGMIIKKIPKHKYAVCTHKGKITEIGKTYAKMEQELKGKEDRQGIFFELYDERFKDGGKDSEVDIYAPLL